MCCSCKKHLQSFPSRCWITYFGFGIRSETKPSHFRRSAGHFQKSNSKP
nr:unnamed protein product [Callosobruchus chinensis]